MRKIRAIYIIVCLFIGMCWMSGCHRHSTAGSQNASSVGDYIMDVYPLERNGVALHLDRVCMKETEPKHQILLIHGVTYSSHEFDLDYQDYSLVRRLAREGYGVWRLDIAGFGQSAEVKDGFMPDSDYASEDINAAVKLITQKTGQEKMDVLGWSWGTVTVSRFVAAHPEHVNQIVLYAPILSGIGAYEVTEPFHHNSWDHAVDDFQRTADGSLDYTLVDPVLVDLWCSSCWRYDKDASPNGGRRDLCVDDSHLLIDLRKIKQRTLVICGDRDPYLNYPLVDQCLKSLPEGSVYEKIQGGSHVVYVETPYHQDFQDRLVRFLLK